MRSTLRFPIGKCLDGHDKKARSKMGMMTATKGIHRPTLGKVNRWVRHHPGSVGTPSQQAIEANSRVAYFWRR